MLGLICNIRIIRRSGGHSNGYIYAMCCLLSVLSVSTNMVVHLRVFGQVSILGFAFVSLGLCKCLFTLWAVPFLVFMGWLWKSVLQEDLGLHGRCVWVMAYPYCSCRSLV